MITGHASEIPDISKKVLYNTTITRIAYNASGVTAYTKEGLTIHAKKAICTFSLGVLQHDDVTFSPALPGWKREAIANFHMVTINSPMQSAAELGSHARCTGYLSQTVLEVPDKVLERHAVFALRRPGRAREFPSVAVF